MLNSYITWNGVRSTTFGLYIKKEPNFNKPRRKCQVYNSESRNGNIVFMQNLWENIVQEYTLFLRPDVVNSDLAQLSHRIANWLHSANDYAELSDSYDADHFRLAYFIDELNIENQLNEFGYLTVRFNCRPEHFLNSGKTETTYTSNFTINNNTGYIAYPLVKVVRSDRQESIVKFASININFTILGQSGTSSNTVTIDCDAKTSTYDYTTGNFPYLRNGSNQIQWTSSNITSVKITPRWWEL